MKKKKLTKNRIHNQRTKNCMRNNLDFNKLGALIKNLYRLLKLPSLLADFVTELLWHKTTKRDGELSFLPLYFCYHLIFSLPDTADSIREQ